MAIIKLDVVVPNVDDVLVYFDQIKVYRSTAGAVGPYVELTGPGTRLELVSGTTLYSYTDTTGKQTYFYRTAFFNSDDDSESAPSDPQEGEGDPALDMMSVDEMKELFLFGLDLVDDAGNPLPDSFFEFYIRAAVDYLERSLNIPLRPLVVVDEAHDFHRRDYEAFNFMKLDNRPVISIQEIRMILPTNQNVITYDLDWIQLDKDGGQVQIVPGSGTVPVIALGLASLWAPFINSMHSFLPRVFRVDYTAGFERGRVPYDIRELVGMLASMGPLAILGDLLFGPGVAGSNVSLDQLMTGVRTTKDAQNSAFGARLRDYRLEARRRIAEIRRYYQGVPMVVA